MIHVCFSYRSSGSSRVDDDRKDGLRRELALFRLEDFAKEQGIWRDLARSAKELMGAHDWRSGSRVARDQPLDLSQRAEHVFVCRG